MLWARLSETNFSFNLHFLIQKQNSAVKTEQTETCVFILPEYRSGNVSKYYNKTRHDQLIISDEAWILTILL